MYKHMQTSVQILALMYKHIINGNIPVIYKERTTAMKRWARSFYQPVLPLGKDGSRVTASREHILLSKEAAREGMVLLKNEKETLPLEKGSRVALFGDRKSVV